MPSECASIGQSPGPTDHLYNAGPGRTVRHLWASAPKTQSGVFGRGSPGSGRRSAFRNQDGQTEL